MVRAYHAAAATLNMMRAHATGGFADLRQVHAWNQEFVRRSSAGQRYERLADEIDRALAFMRACGADLDSVGVAHAVDLWASHEALLLDYESALTRRDEVSGSAYDLSAHLLWIGDRTRAVDDAHVAFAAGISNPIAVKLGPTARPEDAVALVDRLDPDRSPGRLTFVTRLGTGGVRELLPPIVEKVVGTGASVVWTCDPMHGNTVESAGGLKTRRVGGHLGEGAGVFQGDRGAGHH